MQRRAHTGLLVLAMAVAAVVSVSPVVRPRAVSAGAQRGPELPWYVTAGAIHRVTLKPATPFWRFEHLSTAPATAQQQILHWKSEGITALEIFAPEEGGNSYDGLDAKDRFRLDPGLGSIADFRRIVQLAHAAGLRVVTFQNLGYSSPDALQFEAAEDAVRAGKTTAETETYFWSHSADAPPPAGSDSYFFVRPSLPGYQPEKNEFWQWSGRAQAWYWTRWPGKDAAGKTIRLPQYNWRGAAWPAEAERVVRFWMQTGLDGMILDAVNWYAGADWRRIDDRITLPIAGFGNEMVQPEGGGGFGDDPVAWVKDGHFTNIYDYGLGIWWDKKNRALQTSVETGDPALLETALRAYHDRVVAAGGTLYFPVPKMASPELQRLAEALIAAVGDMPCYCDPVGGITASAADIPALLRLKAQHAALFQNSLRRRVRTDDDADVYATVRYAADDSERLLLVFNFSGHPMTATVDAGAMDGVQFHDMLTHDALPVAGNSLRVLLDAYGYRLFSINGYSRAHATSL